MSAEIFALLAVSNLLSLFVSSIYYASRLNDLRVEQIERIQAINADYAMHNRLYGEIQMEQLIGLETFNEDIA